MGGPLEGLNADPMLRTTVLNTRSRAASLGSDTVGGGMSSSNASPETTWLKSCRGTTRRGTPDSYFAAPCVVCELVDHVR